MIIKEEAIVILLGFVVGFFIDHFWATIQRSIPSKKRQGDYAKVIFGNLRIHHNYTGYLSIIIGFLVYPLFLVPIGLGIIAGHRIRDRLFLFVENINKETKNKA